MWGMDFDDTVHGDTELRVHGVSGTPPEVLLEHPKDLIRRVSGDADAGFYRRWYLGGSTRDAPGERHVEAYSWGGLTSGPATRALWLLLLPFTLVNLAHWMLPRAHARRRFAAGAVRALRLLGLSFTLTLLLAVAVLAMDVVGWQCGALHQCSERIPLFAFLGQWSAGPRLAFTALFPTALIVVLWLLGRAVEVPPRAGTPRPPEPAVLDTEQPLAHTNFWAGDPATARLRAAHVTAWAGALGALVLIAPIRYGPGGAAHQLSWGLLVVNAVFLLAAVAATSWNAATGRGGAGADGLTGPIGLLRYAALVVLAASLTAVAFTPAHYPPPPTHLPGLRPAIYALLVAQVLLLVVLWLCTYRLRSDGGLWAPLVATFAWLLGGAFSVGIGLWTANYLGEPVTDTAGAACRLGELESTLGLATATEHLAKCTDAQFAMIVGQPAPTFPARVEATWADLPLIVPPPYFWAAVVAVLSLVFVAALAGVGYRSMVRDRQQIAVDLALDYRDRYDAERARTVAGVRAWARLTDRVGPLFAALTALLVVTGMVGSIVYLVTGPGELDRVLPWLTRLSIGVAGIGAAGAVVLVVWAWRNRQVRRQIGILWDVATFWPRANHPLTPPSYGERAVPELAWRLGALTTGADDRAALCAHSQGGVIAAAAVLQLDASSRQGTVLLTFGSPLRRLYGRYFPAYFGDDTLRSVERATGSRWINLWAPSDPIGGWVLDDAAQAAVDRKLTDPTSLQANPDGTYPPICGHSGYMARGEYRASLADLGIRPPT